MRSTTGRENRKTIIWDWNGTLLNDIDICVSCINLLLGERKLPALDRDRYRGIFTFPVKKYYELAGFDFSGEPFEIPAHQFIRHYRSSLGRAALHPGAQSVLNELRKMEYNQLILSVMEQELLSSTVEAQGIGHFFEQVCGINDHYGHSKSELGLELMRTLDADPSRIVLVGDTLHDHEVAMTMGIRCILISHGHQSRERLEAAGCPVVDNYDKITEVIQSYF
jgi:phosphoglycolate phosphatase